MLPAFHRDSVRRQVEVMTEIAAANVAQWPVGKEFPVATRTATITLEVILGAVIGSSEPARLEALRQALPPVVNMGMLVDPAMINPKLLAKRPWKFVRDRLAAADALIYAEIAARRNDPNLDARIDVLSMLVREPCEDGHSMSDTDLRDQLMTLLFAGHETTATGLAWALERLIRHPALLTRAVDAADASAAGDPAGDEYLDALVKEVLRVRPVVFDVARTLTAPVNLATTTAKGEKQRVKARDAGAAPGRKDPGHQPPNLNPTPRRSRPSPLTQPQRAHTAGRPGVSGPRRCVGGGGAVWAI